MFFELREMYQYSGAFHGRLPKITGLPVLFCKGCMLCHRLFVTYETLRKHCRTEHGKSINRKEVGLVPTRTCQSLYKKKADMRPFLIVEESQAVIMDDVVEYDPGECVALSF